MKIFFTFDPFDKNKWNRKQIKNLIANLTTETDILQAVYVASKAEVNLATAYDVPEKSRFTHYPKKLLEKKLHEYGLTSAKAVVLTESTLSLTKAVEKFARYASKENCDLVLISTNAKSLLPRMVFGSFAETLVHSAKIDLLVYHQKTKTGVGVPKNILYAHDFTSKGDAGLLRVCDYAKKWKASLTVVHLSLPQVDNAKLLSKIKKIERQTAKEGIACEVLLENSWENASTFIIKMARTKHASLIALSAKGDDPESLLGGSIVRKTLRESTLPTLVLKV